MKKLQKSFMTQFTFCGSWQAVGKGVFFVFLFSMLVVPFRSHAAIQPACDLTTDVGKSETFGVVSTDPEGDKLFYTIDWGDKSIQKLPPSGSATLDSGAEQSVNHAWTQAGKYAVSVTATDSNGNVSAPSQTTEPIEIDLVCVGSTQCSTAGQLCKDANNCNGHYSSTCMCIDDILTDDCPLPLPKLRGDLNCDNKVGVEDLGILTHFWGQKTTSSQSLCRTQLDSIGYGRGYDDTVDANDANLISICWGQTFTDLDGLPLADSLKTKCLYLDVTIDSII